MGLPSPAEENTMRSFVFLALSALSMPTLAAGEGLVARPDALGARWGARIELDLAPVLAPWALTAPVLGQARRTTFLMGDYHLDALRFGNTGVRLTSGLLLNQRMVPSAQSESRSTWPYLGIGYAGAGARGDWGFSADVGLAAQNPGAASRLGRVFGGTLDLNDALRTRPCRGCRCSGPAP
jgi:hypothetical protein